MYCRKCGKFIDYDAECCKECEELENYFEDKEAFAPTWQEEPQEEQKPYTPPTNNSPFEHSSSSMYSNPYSQPSYSQPYSQPSYSQPSYSQPVGDKKEGFGKALASTILSTISSSSL